MIEAQNTQRCWQIPTPITRICYNRRILYFYEEIREWTSENDTSWAEQ